METQIDIFNKSFFYQELVEEIAFQVWSSLSSGEKSVSGYVNWVYDKRILQGIPVVEWNYQIIRYDDIDYEYDIWANAGPNESFESSLNLSFVLRKGKHIKKHTIPYAEIYSTIAHELHHIAQNLCEKDSELLDRIVPNLDPDHKMNYFMCPAEVEAFHVGYRAESFITGKPMEELMRAYLENYKDELTDEQIETIIVAWLNPTFEVFNYDVNQDIIEEGE